MFHPTYTYINKTVRDFDAVPLLVPIYDKGQLIYDLPSLNEIKAYATKELDELWNEYKRVLNLKIIQLTWLKMFGITR